MICDGCAGTSPRFNSRTRWSSIAGVLVALREGIELNVLGLTIGFEFRSPALKLPGVGRLGLSS